MSLDNLKSCALLLFFYHYKIPYFNNIYSNILVQNEKLLTDTLGNVLEQKSNLLMFLYSVFTEVIRR